MERNIYFCGSIFVFFFISPEGGGRGRGRGHVTIVIIINYDNDDNFFFYRRFYRRFKPPTEFIIPLKKKIGKFCNRVKTE